MAIISVLIVTYNADDTITECLDSLNGQILRDFEVILVDNDSKDNTKNCVEHFKNKSSFPLKTIYLDFNAGFCLGNNMAFKSASGKYIALLNPDAKADTHWLHNLLSAIDGKKEVGICASKVLTWDGRRIDSAGDMMLTTFRAFKRGEGQDPINYDLPGFIFSACGAGALYKREMIDQIGFFDEDFFIQCDDTDLGFRAQIAGWKVFYVPSAKLYHKVSNSIGKASEISVYYTQRNMELVRIKNVPVSILLFYLPQIIIGLVLDALYFGVRRMRWKTFIKAKVAALRMAPRMIEKRKRILGARKKVSNAYIRALITPLLIGNGSLIKFKIKRALNIV